MSSSMMRVSLPLLLLCAFGLAGARIVRRASDERASREWWETTLVYQVWPRSFQDSNGDGEGDLKGIINRLDYIKDLGVETIWLNPIYSSPLVDGGYDISNHTDVHPLFGTLEDFDELVHQAHARGLKVILDIVPNHSSDQHEWFRLSAENAEPYKDYYVWTDGKTDKDGEPIPPNNWESVYSDEKGSAWTWNDKRKQWYYHKFHKTQPDLNLRNENVRKEILAIFDFWLRRNVDGFRINSVSYFFEDPHLRNESPKRQKARTFGRHENIGLLYEFRSHVDKWTKDNQASSKLLIAEAHDPDDNLIMYYGNETHAGVPPFNTRLITHIDNKSDADFIRKTLNEWMELVPDNKSTNWMLSNHDHSRAPSRIGLDRIDGFTMLNLLLPGQAFTYYGDEIAMLDGRVESSRAIDPRSCVLVARTCRDMSRDPSRTPMQWNDDVSAGFSANRTTYLPVREDYATRNVEAQLRAERSHLKTYRTIAAVRREAVFARGGYELATTNDGRVVILKRFLEDYPVHVVVVNLAPQNERVNLTSLYPTLEESLVIVAASTNAVNVDGSVSRDSFIISENAAVVLRAQEETGTKKETSTENVKTIVEHESSEKSSSEGESRESSNETETGSSTESSNIRKVDELVNGTISSSTTPMTEPADSITDEDEASSTSEDDEDTREDATGRETSSSPEPTTTTEASSSSTVATTESLGDASTVTSSSTTMSVTTTSTTTSVATVAGIGSDDDDEVVAPRNAGSTSVASSILASLASLLAISLLGL